MYSEWIPDGIQHREINIKQINSTTGGEQRGKNCERKIRTKKGKKERNKKSINERKHVNEEKNFDNR